MSRYTPLIQCVEREVQWRKLNYPRLIFNRKMSQQVSEYEQRCMRQVLEILKALDAESQLPLPPPVTVVQTPPVVEKKVVAPDYPNINKGAKK